MLKNLAEKSKNNAIKPFWSWNDELNNEELCRQIEIMKENGIEGFFMHARGGLITEYMSDVWFDRIKTCLDKADELGMQAWAYDENGWPSGFADGRVPKKGIEYQQKHLKYIQYTQNSQMPENVVGIYRNTDGVFSMVDKAEIGDYIIAFTVNPYYIDIMNADVIADFINETYEKYYERLGERFGKSLKGFFTDEPQFGNGYRIPWSFILPQKFEEKYGYKLLDKLPLLFNDTGDSYSFRYDYYSLLNELLTTSYFKQIYDWCEAHNCKFTGHSMMEDCISAQMCANFGVMPSYEYMHEPGIDWLCRVVSKDGITAKQLGSAARQLNKKTMTETFAGCGWDVSLNELKGIAQSQYVHGVASICTHLQSYSTRGERKRDWPASLYIQQPWFDKSFKQFADYFTKLGALLDEAKEYAPLLVIHPIKSAYLTYNPTNLQGLRESNASFSRISKSLHANHISFHYGDETLIKRYGEVNGNLIKIGSCEYKYVLIPDMLSLDENTLNILNEFAQNGGKIYAYNKKPSLVNGREKDELNKLNDSICVINNEEELISVIKDNKFIQTVKDDGIVCSILTLPDGTDIYYMVNIDNIEKTLNVKIDGNKSVNDFCPIKETHTAIPCSYKDGNAVFELKFASYGSFVLAVRNYNGNEVKTSQNQIISLGNEFEVTNANDNCITLDYCEYRINGGRWQDKKFILHIQQELLKLQKPCDIELKYTVNIKDADILGGLRFYTETPDKYIIRVNGVEVKFEDCDKLYDKSVRGTNIGSYMTVGENTVTLSTEFYQDENVYRVLFTPDIHEVERNKLTYNTELEACYITGDFGVEFVGEHTFGDKKAIFCSDTYSLVKPTRKLDITNITIQNYWFFWGEMELKKEITLDKQENVNYSVAFRKLHCPAAHLYINDKFAGDISFAPHTVDATKLLINGKNKITVKLFSGNRNILGPHHHVDGELYSVSPRAFTATQKADGSNAWRDEYAFVIFGAEPY
ncbi:MAG: hypothetical protein IJZ75_02400 [Clostridia bacterium]|nr:hypothetical protein [Clostridia bacterium]